MLVQDFAKNREATYSEEIKSAHFGIRPSTRAPALFILRKGKKMPAAIDAYNENMGGCDLADQMLEYCGKSKSCSNPNTQLDKIFQRYMDLQTSWHHWERTSIEGRTRQELLSKSGTLRSKVLTLVKPKSLYTQQCFFYRDGDVQKRHSMVFLTDDICHGYHAVHHFTLLSVQALVKAAPLVEKIYTFSDGCGGQYKGKDTFADLSLYTGNSSSALDDAFLEEEQSPNVAKSEKDSGHVITPHEAVEEDEFLVSYMRSQ
ncbi:hypothetical protein PoB_006384000 [Plakobranchus ocellatus]|uniref:Uncharacterized protein n=1 Tax=Plakobranchus ocellatus TaxID=259542 RepID=A0AAV4CZW5_9GAST|nr:hypothetical protein PoB_006384000 [Plakobranchus ocellatus]